MIYGPQTTPQPRALRCELCQLQFEKSVDLQDHLRTIHAAPIFEWNPARDCLEGHICRHCQARFTSDPGVRNHIMYGRCNHFDPHADCATLPLDDDITQALLEGTVLDHLSECMDRLRWTVQCLHCGQTYKRSNDLWAHIIQCHADLWHQAQPLVYMLREAWFPRHGCLCNPRLSYPRQNHICPIMVQLAMHHVRSKAPLLQPLLLTEEDMAHDLLGLQGTETLKMVTDAIVQRNFSRLWQDSALLSEISRICCFCGKVTTHPGELLVHLIQHHQAGHVGHKHFVPQLVECMKAEMFNDYQCYACESVFNVPSLEADDPTRPLLVQNHLNFQCPVLQQLAYILAGHGGFGSSVDMATGASRCTDESSLQCSGPVPQPVPETTDDRRTPTQKIKGRKRPSEAPAEGGARQRSAPHHVPKDGGHHSQTGNGTEHHALTRYFHPAHVPRSGGPGANSGKAGRPLACSTQGGNSKAASSIAPSAPHDLRADQPIPGSAESIPAQCPEPGTMDHPPRQEIGQRGRQLAVLALEQSNRGHGAEPGQESSGHGGHANALDGASGTIPESIPCAEVSVHGPANGIHDGMETSGDLEVQRTDGTTLPALLQCGDELGGPQSEVAPTSAIEAGLGASTDAGGQVQRQGQAAHEIQSSVTGIMSLTPSLRHLFQCKVISMQCVNDGNLCPANASTIAWLWATLTTGGDLQRLWGGRAASLFDWLLNQGDTDQVSLKQCEWLQDLFSFWEGFESQADAPEVVQKLIGDSASAFHIEWQRRVEKEGGVSVEETHRHFHPLLLNLPYGPLPPRLNILTLLEEWQQVDGMCSALSMAPDILCIHVQRHVQADDMTVSKSQIRLQAYPILTVPVFEHSGMEVTTQDYILLSMIMHLGTPDAGHYRAATRFWLHGCGWTWALYDDNVMRDEVTDLPTWVEENVILFFYCKRDLHRYARDSEHPVTRDYSSLDRSILAMLH
eukprot:Skav219997  [mRNA]  locus=scaffold947:18358:21246:+ [translate_table: standard]